MFLLPKEMASNKGMTRWCKVLTKRALRSYPIFLALPLVSPPLSSSPFLAPPLPSPLHLLTPACQKVAAAKTCIKPSSCLPLPLIKATGDVSVILCSEEDADIK